MNIKKILALVLALVMALSLFAGCAQEEPAETKAPETFATDGESIPEEDLFKEPVTLKYIMVDSHGAVRYEDFDRIVEAVNKITKEKINATIEFELIPLGEFAAKMAAKYQANEPWDVTFAGLWNNLAQGAANGAFAELTPEMLNTYAPDAMKLINNVAFNATTINGKIYAVPLQQIYVRTTALRYDADYVDSLGFDMSKVTKLEDIESLLAKMIEGGDMNVAWHNTWDNLNNMAAYFNFDFLNDWKVPGAIVDTDASCTVVNQFATDTFKNYAKLMKDWYDKGYMDDSIMIGGENGNEHRYVDIDPAWKPGNDKATSKTEGLTIKELPLGDAVLTTSSINATTHVVSANSQNPGRALAFINLLTSDAELMNLLVNGQEGVDWEWINKDLKLIEKKKGAYPGCHNFLVGNTFNSYYTVAEDAAYDYNSVYAEINLEAAGSPLLGFTFDATNVAGEIANCNAIIEEYLKPIMAGAVADVDAAIAELNSQLEAAGSAAILAEMQAQVNAWKAANG